MFRPDKKLDGGTVPYQRGMLQMGFGLDRSPLFVCHDAMMIRPAAAEIGCQSATLLRFVRKLKRIVLHKAGK